MAGIEIVNKDKEGKIKSEYAKEDGRVVVDTTKEK